MAETTVLFSQSEGRCMKWFPLGWIWGVRKAELSHGELGGNFEGLWGLPPLPNLYRPSSPSPFVFWMCIVASLVLLMWTCSARTGKVCPFFLKKDLYEQGPCWQTIENIHWKITLHHKSVTSKTFSHARHHSQAQGTRSGTSLRKHYFASHKNQRAHYNLLTLFWTWIHMVTSLLAIIVIATT